MMRVRVSKSLHVIIGGDDPGAYIVTPPECDSIAVKIF